MTNQQYRGRSHARIWTVTLVVAASAVFCGSVAAETQAPGDNPAKVSVAKQQSVPAASDTRAAAESVGTASQAISVYVTAAE